MFPQSLVSEGVSKDHVDHLEDIFSPSLLNRFDMHIVAKFVTLRNARVEDFDLTRVINRLKLDEHVSKFLPLLKLPLHLDFFVFFKFLVNSLNRAIEHFKFALGDRLGHGKATGELAHLDLICHAFVNNSGWHAKNGLNLTLLRHFLQNLN